MSQIVTNGLIAYFDTLNPSYPDTIQGRTWYDISGTNKTVTLRPGTSYNPVYKYLSFDGSTNSGTTVVNAGATLTQWTVMLSFYQTTNGTGFSRLAGASPNVDAGEIAVLANVLYINSPESISWFLTSLTASYNTWYHLCVAFNTTTTGVVNMWVYVNGSLINTYTVDGTVENITGYNIANINSNNGEAFVGRMTQFALYNRVLTAGEVLTNYNFYLSNPLPEFSTSSETIYSSGTLVSTQTSVSGNSYIITDLNENPPYLTPDTSNSVAITQWLLKSVNSYSRPFWSNVLSPNSYSTIPVTTGTVSASYLGATVIPDGRVVFCPYNAPSVGVFNPRTNIFTTYGTVSGTVPYYSGGVLLPDNRVLFAPFYDSSIGFFNPNINTFSNVVIVGAGGGQYNGAVLLPDGRVAFVPCNATNVGLYNPATNSYTTFSSGIQAGVTKYNGGVLLPDGRVVFVPGDTGWIGVFNASTSTYTTYTSTITGVQQYAGGVLLPNGNVLFIPWTSTQGIGIFDPSTNTTSFIASPTGFYTGCLLPDGQVFMCPITNSYPAFFDSVTGQVNQPVLSSVVSSSLGCALMMDGRIVTNPYVALTIGLWTGLNRPPPPEFCLHPFFNKF